MPRRPEVTDRIARLIMRLDESGARGDCSQCGAKQWDFGMLTLAAGQQTGGLHVLPLMCSNCGFVRLHSVEHLESRGGGPGR